MESLATRLQAEILKGTRPPGSRLPPERELAVTLGVNRLTLRAALARLEATGFISTRHGSGHLVNSWREHAGLPVLSSLLTSLTPGDPLWVELMASVLELRRFLSAEALALCAERATPESILEIEAKVAPLLRAASNPLTFAEADLQFQRAIARATGNVGFELFLNTFGNWPTENPALIKRLYDSGKEAALLYPALVELIRGGKPENIRQDVRAMLEERDRAWLLRQAQSKPKPSARTRTARAIQVGTKDRGALV